MLKRQEQGITLVALIITIIILVILAAVAITTAYETGIVQYSTDGTRRYAESGVNENKIMNKTVDYMSNALSEIYGILGEKGGSGSTSTPTPTEPTPPTTEGKLEIPKSEGDKPDDSQTVDIGDVTVNDKVLTHGWQYYYEDDNKVYLIYSDYLETDAIPAGANITKSGINVYASTNRTDLINYLTNTNNWTSIANGVKEALKKKGIEVEVTATGGPTVEQLQKAYEIRYPGDNFKVKHFNSGDGNTGGTSVYAEGWYYSLGDQEKYQNNVSVSSKDVYTNQNKVFFPYKASTNGCYGYWLASPSAVGSRYVCYVYYNGAFYYNDFSDAGVGVRPVVSIPKSAIKD